MRERADGLVGVVHALNDTGAFEVVYLYLLMLAALSVEDELCRSRLVGAELHTLVDVAVGMTRDGVR